MSYIDITGNVVWQCWPYFDSSFIFGSLLDQEKGGHFSVTPAGSYTSKQYYEDNTNILVTEFHCKDGHFKLTDFAPRFELHERYHRPLMLFRKITVLSGTPEIIVKCTPVGDYGTHGSVAEIGSNHIAFEGLAKKVRLTTNISKSHIVEEKSFALTEDKYLVLTWGIPLEAPLESTFEEFYKRTAQYWRHWVERSSIPNIYQQHVIRSALLLKLHQYEDTGAIIASGTTSLPEYPGHGRNWDYRYCWIRDTYFTLAALTSLGHFKEAERYGHYIQNLAQKEKDGFQPVYSIMGDKYLYESEIPLSGYLGNRPVRIGNLAYQQVQYDVYGQVLLTIMSLFTDKRIRDNRSRPSIELVNKILDHIIHVIDMPDAGIWEYREKMQRHCESALFHWAGAHAAIRIAEACNQSEVERKAQQVLRMATKNIEACFDPEIKAYGMSIGNKKLNASELLLINMKYLDSADPKTMNHLNALEKELKTDNDLFYRYRDLDDFGETHSTFLICGFWYAEALANVGKLDRAQEVFEKLLGHANELGIFSEDICPENGSQWGNVAQTYSHVGLINTAFKIAQKKDHPSFLA